jgi:HD-like signal output (HDOD) protein
MMSATGVSPDRLREFTSFRMLPEDDLVILAGRIVVKEVRRGEVMFRCGDIDSVEMFLLNGRLQLVADDGRERLLDAGSDAARMPIARLRPRQYTATAVNTVEYFTVDVDLIELLAQKGSSDDGDMDVGYGLMEIDYTADASAEMLQSFQHDLDARKFRLTSLPEVALAIRKVLSEGNADVRQIAALINRDPAIAAKIIRAANSPIYFGNAKVDSVQTAVARLGLTTTRQLVISFTLRDLFQASTPLLRKLMAETWQHCADVAAISLVLARLTKAFNPEEAMLAGLVSNIGMLAVLNYAQSYPQLLEDEVLLRQWIEKLKGQAGALVLEHWQFPDEIVEVARGCEDWGRCPTPQVDLCDLVLVATLHSYIGKRKQPSPPRMDQVPAYQKLALGSLTPELTLQVLVEAREQIEQARAMLAA